MNEELDDDHARYDHEAVSRTWAALGITEYTGKSVDEHVAELVSQNTALREQLAESTARVGELERRLRIPFDKLPCAQCGGPHDFDTSVPSVTWNRVIRDRKLPDYLCTTCIVREFVRVGEGFTAELWNEEFGGVPIEVVVNGQNAKDASAVQEENNSLRNERSELQSRLAQVEKENERLAGQLKEWQEEKDTKAGYL